jgi:hypothetical protein
VESVGFELDLCGSVLRVSEEITVPARAMLSIYYSEIAKQILLPQI